METWIDMVDPSANGPGKLEQLLVVNNEFLIFLKRGIIKSYGKV